MYKTLESINTRPRPFEFYTAEALWTGEHVSKQMLAYHLNEEVDLASRKLSFIDKSAEWITNRFNITKNTRIVDFGCGPGLYCTRFAKTGAKVTGIDFSSNSISYAKKQAAEKQLNIKYVNQNYLEYDTDDKFDLITMIFCDFCPLSPKQRKIILSKFNKMLADNGHVLLDVCSLSLFNKKKESATYERNMLNGFWSNVSYFGFLNSFKYEDEKLLLDKYTIFEENGSIKEIYNWLQCFSKNSISSELAASDLKVIQYYSDVSGTPYQDDSLNMAVVIQKE